MNETNDANPGSTAVLDRADPIDLLVPPPRSLPVRLVIGLVIVGLVATMSLLIGFGYVYPQPECCGSGGGSPMLTLADDGESVVLLTSFFNSSGRDLRIESADVTMPGATVLEVGFAPNLDSGAFWPVPTTPAPVTLGGTDMGRIAIRFVPDDCATPSIGAWGNLVLHLDVLNGWLPSFGRAWDVPGGLVDVGTNDLGVLPPDGFSTGSDSGDPLREACALLAA